MKSIYTVVGLIPDPKGYAEDYIECMTGLFFENKADAEKWVEVMGPHSLYAKHNIRRISVYKKGEYRYGE